MSRKHIAALICIPGGIWVFMAGLYFALIWARQFPHGIMWMMGGAGAVLLLVAAAVFLWPAQDPRKTPRPVKAVLLSEQDQ